MRKSLIMAITCCAMSSTAFAQTLYMPRPVKKAFAKQTRSPDGRPGPKYWQNRGRYSISITVAPPDRNVKGTEQITYFNNSPDTLKSLVYRFIVNIHKPGAPRAGGAIADYLTPGVQIDRFTVNGAAVTWPAGTFFTVRNVALPTPLAPHDSVRLSFDWHYEVSKRANREGMIDSTTYYLAYFYPRVSVYDDYSGWDTFNFNDNLEFYNDFNDYDVSVTVPARYIVWGTGGLLNAGEVLQPAYAQRYNASLTSDETIHVATSAELAAGGVTAQQASNTWRFRAANVTDVTYAISDHFNWDAASVIVDTAAHRRVSVQAAYNDSAADFRYMVQFTRDALAWFSYNWPGVAYPYEKMTVVRGDADMEYPMMVNDGSNRDTTESRFVVNHEAAHTYFPFYMGINETRYTFMDEGWATALEYLIGLPQNGPVKNDSAFKAFRVRGWTNSGDVAADIPIISPNATGNTGYGRPALGYLALKDLLGDDVFRKALHAYMDRWHSKHPIPWDFFNTFNNVTGSDLNWFWQSWFFDPSYIDLAISNVTKNSVVIDNIGGMPAPVDLVVTYTDGATQRIHETPAIWKRNVKQATVSLPSGKPIRGVELNGGIWMDADTSNNVWPRAK
jgi:hypothetical protein